MVPRFSPLKNVCLGGICQIIVSITPFLKKTSLNTLAKRSLWKLFDLFYFIGKYCSFTLEAENVTAVFFLLTSLKIQPKF